MGLRMKNFNILGIPWKIQLLGGSSQKTNIEGGLPKKGGLGQFGDLGGAWQEGGGVFEGGWYPNAHYDHDRFIKRSLLTLFLHNNHLSIMTMSFNGSLYTGLTVSLEPLTQI